MDKPQYEEMLSVALEEARQGFAEGGIPIGAALFTAAGQLVSRGRNRRVQQADPASMVKPMHFDAPVANAVIVI